MKYLSPWTKRIFFLSLFLNIFWICFYVFNISADRNATPHSQIEESAPISAEKTSNESKHHREGHGWQYWLMVAVTIIFMVLMMIGLGAMVGFFASIGVLILIFIFFVSPEFGFWVSLPILLSYTMDK